MEQKLNALIQESFIFQQKTLAHEQELTKLKEKLTTLEQALNTVLKAEANTQNSILSLNRTYEDKFKDIYAQLMHIKADKESPKVEEKQNKFIESLKEIFK